ncbi:MAG: restriction endonuclease subunit S [Flavobacteriales bacterium]
MGERRETEFGSIPAEWGLQPVRELATRLTDYVSNGSFASLAENVNYMDDDGYAILIRLTDYNAGFHGPFVTVSEPAYRFLKKSMLRGGEIIISNVGAYAGTVFMCPRLNKPMTLGPNAIVLEFDGANDFYYYWFTSTFGQFMLSGIISGSAQPKFNKTSFRPLLVPVPPPQEREAISAVLKSLDAKIDLLHRQNKTLEAMAETLFRQWFVEEAEEGWEEMRLDQFSTVGIGRTPPRKEQHWFSTDSTDVKWISIKDMAAEGPFIFSTAEYLTDEAIERFRVPVIPKDTVILSFKMTLGRLKITTEAMLSNEAIAHFRVNPDSHVTKEFLYLGLKTYQYETLGSTSTIVDSINSGMIREMVLQIPPEPLMDLFMEQCGPWFEKIKSNQVQIKTLIALRDTLLPKLMSGEVRVEL